MDSSSRWPQIIANIALPQDQAIELPESGWGALIAWLAGPTWAHPDPARVLPPVTVSVISAGATSEAKFDRTPEDQTSIDDDIAAYLADADVPPQPRAMWWSLRRPAGMDEPSFWTQVHQSMYKQCPDARLPREIRACLTRVLAAILSPLEPSPTDSD
jgi:hypothetical protein